jgi:hypothetical protein
MSVCVCVCIFSIYDGRKPVAGTYPETTMVVIRARACGRLRYLHLKVEYVTGKTGLSPVT